MSYVICLEDYYARLYNETIWPNNQLVIRRDLAISRLLPVPNTTQIAGDIRSKLCETSTDKIAEGFLTEFLAMDISTPQFPGDNLHKPTLQRLETMFGSKI